MINKTYKVYFKNGYCLNGNYHTKKSLLKLALKIIIVNLNSSNPVDLIVTFKDGIYDFTIYDINRPEVYMLTSKEIRGI